MIIFLFSILARLRLLKKLIDIENLLKVAHLFGLTLAVHITLAMRPITISTERTIPTLASRFVHSTLAFANHSGVILFIVELFVVHVDLVERVLLTLGTLVRARA